MNLMKSKTAAPRSKDRNAGNSGHPKHLRSFPDFVRSPVGGAGRDRTDDLRLAKAALPQLSYSPIFSNDGVGGPKWIRTTDLTVISRAL